MPNVLTGDFNAVLQVSGKTINRLLASMHQNAFANRDVPSFPHTIGIRIGEGQAFEGVRGVVYAQIGVPAVELIHRATDRFILEVGVRAWYRPDPGTEALPSFIHGTVRAEYRVHEIEPWCPGWAHASDFLWVRVVRDSVTFKGTAEDESTGTGSLGSVTWQSIAADIDKVTRQIAWQLATRFEATPHRLKPGFRRGMLRSLRSSAGTSAVAVPVAMNGEPVGQISSIETVLVGDADFAIGVSADFITAEAEARAASWAESIKKFTVITTVTDDIVGWFSATVSGDYSASIRAPSVEWRAQGSFAVLRFATDGSAHAETFGWPSGSFTVVQDLVLSFDGEKFVLAALSSPTVTVPSTPFTELPIIGDFIRDQARALVETLVQQLLTTINQSLPNMTPGIDRLKDELVTLDAAATAGLDTAEFLAEAVILRGRIGLAPRLGVVVKHERAAAGDAHSALESWIPGGRIDRMEWSWSWAGSGNPGTATFRDRFLLQRPPGELSRWGLRGVTTPLPGLDGYGEVCLQISGVRVDPVSGDLKPVVSRIRCTRFGGFVTTLASERSRLFLRDMPQLSKDVPFPQLKERPVLAVPRGRAAAGTVNTLLVHVDDGWHGEVAETLTTGLRTCGRYDAGLAVLVLFRDGVIAATGAAIVEEIETLLRRLGVAAHVNEDVDGGWSRALQLRGGSGGAAWAIIAPDGTKAWSHEGRIAPDALASALDTHLRASPDFTPVLYRPRVQVGTRISGVSLNPSWREPTESPCPPMPLDRLGEDTVVTFVQKKGMASATHLRHLAGRARIILVVVDDADQREAELFQRESGVDCVAIPDPTGAISDLFEIGVWPTTVTLNQRGIVADIELGVAGRKDEVRRAKYG
jgi:hypothetical protein